MGNVLYEAHFQIEPFMLIPVIMLVFIAFFPKIQEKSFLQSGTELSETAKIVTRIFCIAGSIFVSLITTIAIIGQTHIYIKTVGSYKNNQYELVEGYVENFDPMPYAGHSNESFEINGVYFEYSDYNLVSGYHNAKSHGGVITGDGQYLKIGYIYYNSTYGNIIVYIEELPSP